MNPDMQILGTLTGTHGRPYVDSFSHYDLSRISSLGTLMPKKGGGVHPIASGRKQTIERQVSGKAAAQIECEERVKTIRSWHERIADGKKKQERPILNFGCQIPLDS